MHIRILVSALLCLSMTHGVLGQQIVKFKILDKETNEPLAGATASTSPTDGDIADENGIATLRVASGLAEVKVTFSFVGYGAQSRVIKLPLTNPEPVLILMEMEEEEMEEVIVTTTRNSRSIEDIPTRIEFLGTEELEEKAVMRSDNIAMLLRESTGIQMQVTSPSSANQSIRIQGLDGRYTQLLKDGFPLFGGFSGGLSIMQIPPLDLKQVEVIKGSNSTLYGGGAIAGLVNLVSIQPEEKSRLKIMLDQTSAGGTTLNTFSARRGDKFGYSFFASGNRQNAYDPNSDNFSEIPDVRSLTLNPTFFYYPSSNSKLRLSLNGTFEDRLGGNLNAIDAESPSNTEYLQENSTRRLSYQATYSSRWGDNKELVIKNSLLHFDRSINQFNYAFDGEQWSTFSEATYSFGDEMSSWVLGLNVYSDKFKEGELVSTDRSYSQVTGGLFAQQVSKLSDRFSIETGFRLDRNNDYGWFALPRVALFYKPNTSFTYRLSGGLGYKTPTIFTEDTERLSFRGLNVFNLENLDAERSYGGNFDINYRTEIGNDWTFSLNQLFFYTRLNDPLVLAENPADNFFFENASGPVSSRGIESNMKLTYKDFKFFFNYALIDTRLEYENLNDQKPLTAKHNIGTVLVYEEEGKWRLGLEAYYTSQQLRNDLSETDDFWIVGFMALRKFKKVSVYLNFENFTDTRQSRFENINLGSSMTPETLDVWAPLEGIVVNGGLILELGH
ncbi:TonB-dependent receptor domain-containing protein [Roseivirga sp. E12]|uniref:TonB-dependent receptor n=1 Tax=Roseivirga sp. E12 TaxID=2819237 RepID=UPI001ABC4FB1|nr:TonB-dependent receptor [Roseivirga sp. E12]MBO3700729.1 TonB-dependent receptor plug domain-containing protein [Roseivirga sp. E12]